MGPLRLEYPLPPLNLLGSLGKQVAILPACLFGAGMGTQQACGAGQGGGGVVWGGVVVVVDSGHAVRNPQ